VVAEVPFVLPSETKVGMDMYAMICSCNVGERWDQAIPHIKMSTQDKQGGERGTLYLGICGSKCPDNMISTVGFYKAQVPWTRGSILKPLFDSKRRRDTE
jgi:hypothetical protein